MDTNPIREAFEELFPYLEALETRTAALLQFVKDKKLMTDEKFAPYLEQAGNASNIKWLAARKRIEYLLSSLEKDFVKDEESKSQKSDEAEEEKQRSAGKSGEEDKQRRSENGDKEDEGTDSRSSGAREERGARSGQSGDDSEKASARKEENGKEKDAGKNPN